MAAAASSATRCASSPLVSVQRSSSEKGRSTLVCRASMPGLALAGHRLSIEAGPLCPARFISVLSIASRREVRRNAILALDPDFYKIPYVEGIPVGKRLKLWNLPPNCDREEFLEWFSGLDGVSVESVEFTDDLELNAQGIGGFIEFGTKQEACMAIVRRDGHKFKGRCIRMDFVEKRPHEREIGGRRNRPSYRNSGSSSSRLVSDFQPRGSYGTRSGTAGSGHGTSATTGSGYGTAATAGPGYGTAAAAPGPSYGSTKSPQSPGTAGTTPGYGSTQSAPSYGSSSTSSNTQAAPNYQSAPIYGGSQSASSYGSTPGSGVSQSAPSYGSSQYTPSYGSTQSTSNYGSTQSAPSYGSTQSTSNHGNTQSAPSYGSSESTSNYDRSKQSALSYGNNQSTASYGSTQSASSYGTTDTSLGYGGNPSYGSTQPSSGYGGNPSVPSYGGTQSAPGYSSTQSVPNYSASVQSAPSYDSTRQSAPIDDMQSASSYVDKTQPPQSYGSTQSTSSYGSNIYGNTQSPPTYGITDSPLSYSSPSYGRTEPPPSYSNSNSGRSEYPRSYGSSEPGPTYGGNPGYGSPRPSSLNRIFVGNLPWSTDDMGLQQLFNEFGTVLEARVVRDRDSGRSRGFGFVSMSTADEMQAAINALDGCQVEGRPLKVNEAASRF